MEAELEMTDAERPADAEGAPAPGAARNQRHPAAEREQGERPQVQRCEAGRGDEAEQQRETLWPAIGEEGDAGRRCRHAVALAPPLLPPKPLFRPDWSFGPRVPCLSKAPNSFKARAEARRFHPSGRARNLKVTE